MKPLDMPKKEEKAEAAPAEAVPEVPAEPEKIDFSNVVIEPLFQDQVDSTPSLRAISVPLRCWIARR